MILLHAFLLVGYACGSVAAWMRLDEGKVKALHWLMLLLVTGHLALLSLLFGESEGRSLSFTVPAFALAVLVVGWLQNAAWPVYGTYRFILPLCLAGLGVSLAVGGHGWEATEATSTFWIHIGSATVAYSLVVLAFVLMLVRGLESDQLAVSLEGAGGVPILMIERLAIGNLHAGLAILTIALASGAYITIVGQDSVVALTHKNLFALLTWIVLVVFACGHHIRGWRGRTALIYMGIGLAFLMLSYFGTSFVLRMVLGK